MTLNLSGDKDSTTVRCFEHYSASITPPSAGAGRRPPFGRRIRWELLRSDLIHTHSELVTASSGGGCILASRDGGCAVAVVEIALDGELRIRIHPVRKVGCLFDADIESADSLPQAVGQFGVGSSAVLHQGDGGKFKGGAVAQICPEDVLQQVVDAIGIGIGKNGRGRGRLRSRSPSTDDPERVELDLGIMVSSIMVVYAHRGIRGVHAASLGVPHAVLGAVFAVLVALAVLCPTHVVRRGLCVLV